MTAVSLVILEHDDAGKPTIKEHEVEGFSYSPMGKVDGIPYNREVKEQPLGAVADVAAVSALCNDARILGYDDDNTFTMHPDMNTTVPLEESASEADNATKTTMSVIATKSSTRKKKKPKKKMSCSRERTYERIGEPTEAALCVLTEKLGGMSHYLEEGGQLDRSGLHFNVPPSVLASANVDSWRNTHPRLATLEFSRDRKSMSVLCEFPKGDYPATAASFRRGLKPRKAGNRLLVKGAPNLLIERCTHVKFRDGTVSKMNAELRREIEERVSELATRPLRCLALAVKENADLEDSLRNFAPTNERDVSKHPLLSNSANYRNIESGLTLVGVVGIKDPPRPGVAKSIDECSKAGIRVILITGDAIDTAVAIAKDVHIFPPDSEKPLKAFQGREFFLKSPHEQREILKEDNIVFCRAEPADKQKLVKMLQSLNEITAMTGKILFSKLTM
jgi:Ca2+-transporting ATPase